MTREAPAGSWVVFVSAGNDLVYVRVIDARQAGVVVSVRVFDRHSRRFLREERP